MNLPALLAAAALVVHGLSGAAPLVEAAAAPLAEASASGASTARSEYLIAPGDLVRVSVFQNPELTLEARVHDDGSISYPLLGAVAVAGQSAPQAEQRIAEGLRRGAFVRQPQERSCRLGVTRPVCSGR